MDMQDDLAPDGGDGLPGSPLGGGGRLDPGISVVTATGDQEFRSVSRAARALTQARQRSKQDQSANPPSADNVSDPRLRREDRGRAAADAPRESAVASLRSATEDLSSETRRANEESLPSEARRAEEGGETEDADPAESPPIEPPRSWTDEDNELWKGLPRATQMRLAERERSRESDFLRRQNETADNLKAVIARELATEQVRREYEAALPALLQSLQDQQADEFADIKSPADIERLAREDRPRYLRWETKQQKVAELQRRLTTAQARSAQDREHWWAAYARRQDELFIEQLPELADSTKAARAQESAVAALKDIGFTEQELGQLWRGQAMLTLRDHKVQRLVLDGIKYRETQQKAKEVVVKSVPPVPRPGVSQPRGAAQDAAIQALSKRLETSGNLKDAAALIAARRKAAR